VENGISSLTSTLSDSGRLRWIAEVTDVLRVVRVGAKKWTGAHEEHVGILRQRSRFAPRRQIWFRGTALGAELVSTHKLCSGMPENSTI
jgi:hypothetical protein